MANNREYKLKIFVVLTSDQVSKSQLFNVQVFKVFSDDLHVSLKKLNSVNYASLCPFPFVYSSLQGLNFTLNVKVTVTLFNNGDGYSTPCVANFVNCDFNQNSNRYVAQYYNTIKIYLSLNITNYVLFVFHVYDIYSVHHVLLGDMTEVEHVVLPDLFDQHRRHGLPLTSFYLQLYFPYLLFILCVSCLLYTSDAADE